MKLSNSKSTMRSISPFIALAGAAATIATSNANATVISQTNLNQEIAFGTILSNIGGMNGVSIDYFSNGSSIKSSITNTSGQLTSPLSGGTVIGPASSFQSLGTPYYLTSSDVVKATGLIGLSFDNGAGTQYGWVDVSAIAGTPDSDPSDNIFDGSYASVFLKGWGYEDEIGKPVTTPNATDVNEPVGLALLALGAAGLAASRRRKIKIAANA